MKSPEPAPCTAITSPTAEVAGKVNVTSVAPLLETYPVLTTIACVELVVLLNGYIPEPPPDPEIVTTEPVAEVVIPPEPTNDIALLETVAEPESAVAVVIAVVAIVSVEPEPLVVIAVPPAKVNALPEAVADPVPPLITLAAVVVNDNVEPDPEDDNKVPSPVIVNTPEEGVAEPLFPATDVIPPIEAIEANAGAVPAA